MSIETGKTDKLISLKGNIAVELDLETKMCKIGRAGATLESGKQICEVSLKELVYIRDNTQEILKMWNEKVRCLGDIV